MVIRINPTLFRKIACKLGFHRWQCVGSWIQEAKTAPENHWYAQWTWKDYYCPYCGKWIKWDSSFSGKPLDTKSNDILRNIIKYPTTRLPDIINKNPQENRLTELKFG